jgi:hypothetical protein
MRNPPVRELVAALAAAIVLSACEDRPAKVSAPPPNLDEPILPDAIPPTDAVGLPPAVIFAPFNLPAYAPVRPGATIEAAQAAAPSGGAGGLVTFTARASPAEVAEFYRRRLQAEFGAVSDAENARVRLISAARSGTRERVDITIAPAAEGGSRVTIAYVLPF